MIHSPNAVQAVVAGEALIDLIRRDDGAFEACLGGSVYNLSRALSRQGVATAYLNPFSSDRFGRLLAEQMREDGVQLGRTDPVPEVTSLAVVAVDADGHPDYAFYREGVADRQIDSRGLNAACIGFPALRWVCTGGLALDPRDAHVYRPWLIAQREAGHGIAIDANLRPAVMKDAGAYRAHVLDVLQQAHLIKVSDEDLDHLDLPGSDALAQAEELLRRTSAPWLALTRGPEGACLLGRDGLRLATRESAELVIQDTVGAGDSFFAGLLAVLMRHPPRSSTGLTFSEPIAREALQHAIACASLCVQQSGCVPPSLQQARDWRLRHPVAWSG